MTSKRLEAIEKILQGPFPGEPAPLLWSGRQIVDSPENRAALPGELGILVTADASYMIDMHRVREESHELLVDVWDRTASAIGFSPDDIIVDLWEEDYPHAYA